MALEERKFSQTPVVETVDPNDTVLLITANGANARATVAQLAQEMSDSQVTKESIGLGNVDNTADADKPISTATAQALTQVNTRIDNLPSGVSQVQVDESIATAIEPLATSTALTEGLATKADTGDLEGLATTEVVNETFSRAVVFPSLLEFASGQYPVFHDDQWVVGDSKQGSFIWVNSAKAPLFRDGSYEFPFETIQEAIDFISANPVGGVINVVAGSAHYAGFTINNLLNLQIQGFGLNDAQQVKIQGEIVYTSANCTRIKLKDIQIQSSANDRTNFTVNGTQGRHYFENVTLSRFSGSQTAPVFDVTGNFSNWIDCFNCNFDGVVALGGTPAASALFATRGGNDDGTKIIQTAAVNIVVNNHSRMGYIEHVAGNLSVSNVQHWTGVGGVAIKSTAPAAAGNALSILYSDFLKDNGTWLKIDKSGDAAYRLGFVNRNAQLDALNGSRIVLGGSSGDLQSDYTAVNYPATLTDSVKDHMAAIDGVMINRETLALIASTSPDFATFKAALETL